jgi:hypothetical protein
MRYIVQIFLIFSVLFFALHAEALPAQREMSPTVPLTLEEAHGLLDQMLNADDKKLLKEGTDATLEKYYYELNRYISNTWLIQPVAPLKEYFLQKGISDIERMVRIIINSYHQYLNGRTIQIGDDAKKRAQ